jgi:hypothetical protein
MYSHPIGGIFAFASGSKSVRHSGSVLLSAFEASTPEPTRVSATAVNVEPAAIAPPEISTSLRVGVIAAPHLHSNA